MILMTYQVQLILNVRHVAHHSMAYQSPLCSSLNSRTGNADNLVNIIMVGPMIWAQLFTANTMFDGVHNFFLFAITRTTSTLVGMMTNMYNALSMLNAAANSVSTGIIRDTYNVGVGSILMLKFLLAFSEQSLCRRLKSTDFTKSCWVQQRTINHKKSMQTMQYEGWFCGLEYCHTSQCYHRHMYDLWM